MITFVRAVGQRGALLLLSEDGVQHLQLGGAVFVDPDVEQLVQPGDEMQQ